MDHLVERRVTQRDPREVLSAEVLALLRVCGGIRETDHAVLDDAPGDNPPLLTPGPARTRR
jgi:hypothetical protein